MKGVFLMIEDFINYMQNKGVSENTYNSYANDIKMFNKYYEDSYGEEKLEDLKIWTRRKR